MIDARAPALSDPKVCKLGLVYGQKALGGQYEVKTITNSTLFTPGQWLDPPRVQALCDDPTWDVTIADDQTFQMILSTVLGGATKAAMGKIL